MELILIYMSLALVISFMCSFLEATMLTTPMTYVTTLESRGAKGSSLLRKYKTNIDRPLTAILAVNTIANTVGASLVGSQAFAVAEVFDISADLAVGGVSIIFTFMILIFSEILPKKIASNSWRRCALPAVKVVRVLVFITYPLVLMFEHLSKLISGNKKQVYVSREEVSAIVTVGAEEGVLQKKENKMIQNLLRLDKVTAHEIMTPSVVVSMADEKMTLREFYKTQEFNKYSRIPVYADDQSDYIRGYVLRQTILERLAEDKFDIRLSELMRPILSFSETESVANIWEKLVEKKEHISIIIDEYGCLRGIVTMEDVIETMLGFEIVDESDAVVDMQELARAQWRNIQRQQKKS